LHDGLQAVDPAGIANRSVTYVKWFPNNAHPALFRSEHLTPEFVREVKVRHLQRSHKRSSSADSNLLSFG
jgi:hypothetical protein